MRRLACWSYIPNCWRYHVTAHTHTHIYIYMNRLPFQKPSIRPWSSTFWTKLQLLISTLRYRLHKLVSKEVLKKNSSVKRAFLSHLSNVRVHFWSAYWISKISNKRRQIDFFVTIKKKTIYVWALKITYVLIVSYSVVFTFFEEMLSRVIVWFVGL